MLVLQRNKDVYDYSFLSCPIHQLPLAPESDAAMPDTLVCPEGDRFPIIGNIPRFVPTNTYVSSFGLQWNVYRNTQLDSYTGLSITHDRLTRLAGGSLEVFEGKDVLEAGCGAGRFTEILLDAGAHVFAADLSSAVEANYANFKNRAGHFICQADILSLPVSSERFDIVLCIGVIQHTPEPEQTIRALCNYIKPGGLLIIDHYTYGYPMAALRRLLRSILLSIPSPSFRLSVCRMLVAILWPVHCLLWEGRGSRIVKIFRPVFLSISPVVDYHDAYPQLGPDLLYTWAILDTHDTLTDYYKHLRSAEEIASHLRMCGMVEVETVYAGNGVEARAKKPLIE